MELEYEEMSSGLEEVIRDKSKQLVNFIKF